MQQAMDKAEQLIAAKPRDAQGRFLKGLIFIETGRQAEAITAFTQLTEDFPELPEPYNNLAVLYAQQKQYDKARTALEMAIRTHPSYSIAHENLGDVYAKLASQAYDKALQLDSSNKATQTKLAMIRDLTVGKPGVKPNVSPESLAPAPKPVVTEPVSVKPAEPPAAVKPAAAAVPVPPPPPPAIKPVEKVEKVAAAPAMKPSETRPPLEKAPALSSSTEADVIKALQGWAAAWSNKDVKAYLGYYAADFQTPNGMARKAWETERAQRIDKPGKILVSVDEIKVSLSGEKDKIKVRFRQSYKSASLKSQTGKTVIFVKSGSRWLIQQERIG